MKNWTQITTIAIFVFIAAILVYDLVVILSAGKDHSVSQVIIDLSYAYPSLTFLAGFTCGHLFWRMPERKQK